MTKRVSLFKEYSKLSNYATKHRLGCSKQRMSFFKRTWKSLFCKQLKIWGWNSKAQKDLFGFGEYGHNWKKLHPTPQENSMDLPERMKDFADDLDYCSDRMTLDRLLRIHWVYNQIVQAFKG